jgi:hypothetical protein
MPDESIIDQPRKHGVVPDNRLSVSVVVARCDQCGAEFKPKRNWQRFCAKACSDAWFRAERLAAMEAWRKRR